MFKVLKYMYVPIWIVFYIYFKTDVGFSWLGDHTFVLEFLIVAAVSEHKNRIIRDFIVSCFEYSTNFNLAYDACL